MVMIIYKFLVAFVVVIDTINNKHLCNAAANNPPILRYSCDAQGVTNVTEDNDKVILVQHGTYCVLSNSSCYLQHNKTIHVLYNPVENNTGIIGGRNAYFYELKCLEKKEYDANATALLTIESVTRTYIQQTIEPTKPSTLLTLKIGGNISQNMKFHLGDELNMTLTGPEGYTVQPKSCAAYPGSIANGQNAYDLWKSDDCKSKDSAVIEDAWSTKDNTASVKLFAFRFVQNEQVTIVCTAHLCPSSKSCAYNCPNGTSDRQKREAKLTESLGDGSIDGTATASFTIVSDVTTPNSSPAIPVYLCVYVICAWIAKVFT